MCLLTTWTRAGRRGPGLLPLGSRASALRAYLHKLCRSSNRCFELGKRCVEAAVLGTASDAAAAPRALDLIFAAADVQVPPTHPLSDMREPLRTLRQVYMHSHTDIRSTHTHTPTGARPPVHRGHRRLGGPRPLLPIACRHRAVSGCVRLADWALGPPWALPHSHSSPAHFLRHTVNKQEKLAPPLGRRLRPGRDPRRRRPHPHAAADRSPATTACELQAGQGAAAAAGLR